MQNQKLGYKIMNIAFLASHNGSAANAITNACHTGVLNAVPKLLISNNPDAGVLLWAKDIDIPTHVINVKNTNDIDERISELFLQHHIDIVVCSGYMKLIGAKTIAAVSGKILNVHPALLPLYGGKGMYGRHVHQSIFDNKDKQTGITIHLVDGEYDHGAIVAQKTIPLDVGDDVDIIEAKVKAAEPEFYIEVLQKIISGKIKLP